MPALRDLILARARDVERRPVPCPELFKGTDVSDTNLYVRGMTVAETDRWELMKSEQKNSGGMSAMKYWRAHPVVMCTSDKDGNPVFTEEDLDAVNALPIAPIDRLYWAIKSLSDGEPLEKKSATASASSSDSPSASASGTSTV